MAAKKILAFFLITAYLCISSLLAGEIHDAVHQGDMAKVTALLKKDLSLVNALDEEHGYAPIHYASFARKAEVLKLLISKGAEIDIGSKDNQNTALHFAAFRGYKDISELLLSAGAEVNKKDADGRTALHQAAWYGNDEIVSLLIEKKADVNSVDNYGDTPLHGACYGGFENTAKILIEQGAKLSMKNDIGNTPLHLAIKRNHKTTIDLLQSKGAKLTKEEQKPQPAEEEKAIKITETKFAKMTVLYDNFIYAKDTKDGWGFACLVELPDETILFDTGAVPDILWHNIKALGIDVQKIDKIVISHHHGDHTGSLVSLLEKNNKAAVYLPSSYSYELVRLLEKKNARLFFVDKPSEISPGVYSTGDMGDMIHEQSLIINTKKGLVIVTGCSHQGIADILKQSKQIADREIHLVFGGFHLGNKSEAELNEIIAAFKKYNVQQVGATHCTGEKPIQKFKDTFKNNFISIGTGKVILMQEK